MAHFEPESTIRDDTDDFIQTNSRKLLLFD